MKKIFNLIFILVLITAPVWGQDQEYKYRRSSLDVVFVTNFNDWSRANPAPRYLLENYVLPDKYNDHSVGDRIVDLNKYMVSDDAVAAMYPKFKSTLAKHELFTSQGMPDTAGELKTDEYRIKAAIMNYMDNCNIPGMLVSKWFNGSTTKKDGSFYNMDLILERGAYNATRLELIRSKESIRGMSILNDAGMELIPYTFILFISLEIRTSHDVLGRASQGALGDLYKLLDETSSGYYVSANTYLFQLNWTNDNNEKFLTQYWDIDDSTKLLKDKSIASVKFLGSANGLSEVVETDTNAATAIMMQKTGSNNQYMNNRPIEVKQFDLNNLLIRATNRAIDQAVASLQKQYEDFKVKAPLIDAEKDCVSAFVGLKEGITDKTKFEVLDQIYNETDGTFRYKRIGTINIEKGKIWDNRFNIEGLPEDQNDKKLLQGLQKGIDRTYFTGSSTKLAPGMLIRQIK